MKILQLVTSRKSRGAEISAFLLSQELIKRGHQVVWAGLYPIEGEMGILTLENSTNLDLTGNPQKSLDFKLIFELRKLIQKHKPDIIQANGSDTWKYSVLALIGNSKPRLVYRNISIMSHWVGPRPWIKRMYRLLAKRVDYFCSVGEVANEDIKKLLNIPDSKSGVIRRGFEFYPVDKAIGKSFLQINHGINPGDFVCVQVGSLSVEKNLEFSLHLIVKLKKNIPNLKLLIIGEGVQRQNLEKLKSKLSLENHVFFLGHQKEDLNKIIAGSDIMLLTSHIEGVPGVLMEGMLSSVPVIASSVGGVPELVKNGETGWCISPNDLEAFAKAIQEVSEMDEISRKKILGQAYNLVISNYSLSKVTQQFEELYQSLLATSKSK